MMEGAAEPAALVSDVVMPGLDGFDLAARLRARFPRLPVLLVSGYAESALGRDLEGEGLRLLPKPYRLEELVAALHRSCPRRRSRFPKCSCILPPSEPYSR
jgi:two-component system cell cycle sensor histidine kinase/response regulator CckA